MATHVAGESAMNNRILLRLLLGFPKRRERHCGTTARAQLGTEQLEPRTLLSATPTGDREASGSLCAWGKGEGALQPERRRSSSKLARKQILRL